MTDVPPVSTSVGIDILKKSEDLAASQVAQLLPPLSASPTAAPTSDSAAFSPAALAQLAQTQSGTALLS
jgi:hypothetical protein